MSEQGKTYTAKWCEVDDCYKLSNGTEELADLFVCEESANHITAVLNACERIRNPAAIRRVVDMVREQALCPDCGSYICQTDCDKAAALWPWREALAELDEEGPR